ncbi:MAG: hypothetical protein QM817_30175 [Archangium sp.]
MGFYDYRCHATGLSLRAEDAVAILVLEETKGRWVPASLPMFGTYNRLGTIDSVVADFHTAMISEGFAAAVESKRITMKGEAGGGWKRPREDWNGRPVTGIDRALFTVERATSLGSSDLKLSGRALDHVLLHAGFFRAALAALSAPEPEINTEAMLERTFPFEPSRWFLRELPELTAVRPQARALLNSLHAWREFIEPRVAWAPSQGMGQHGALETLDGFATARARFSDVPWAMAALDAAQKVAEAENDDLPSGWLRNAECSWYGLIIDGERHVSSSVEEVRANLEQYAEELLFDEKPELLVVTRGRLAKSFDLKPLLYVKAGAKTAKRYSPEGEDLVLEDGSTIVFLWDEIASVLPLLEGAPLPGGSAATLRIEEPRPSWLNDTEKYADVIHFDA